LLSHKNLTNQYVIQPNENNPTTRTPIKAQNNLVMVIPQPSVQGALKGASLSEPREPISDIRSISTHLGISLSLH